MLPAGGHWPGGRPVDGLVDRQPPTQLVGPQLETRPRILFVYYDGLEERQREGGSWRPAIRNR
jgi:hypothetical protein